MAGKVIWHISMSLDGFIAGPNDAVEWTFESAAEPSPEADEVVRTTGAILGGRRWRNAAEAKYNGLDGIYGGQWIGPVIILTHQKTEYQNPGLVFTAKPIAEAVSIALEAAKGKDVVILGANVAQQAIRAGLLDEVLVHIVPVLLGDGVRLIEKHSVGKTDLETISIAREGQMTVIRLRVLK